MVVSKGLRTRDVVERNQELGLLQQSVIMDKTLEGYSFGLETPVTPTPLG